MGASFFNTQKSSELAAGSAAFAALILATPTAFGLTSAQATAYGTVNTAFQNAMAAIAVKGTKSPNLVLAKNQAQKNLKIAASNLAKIIQGTPTVTDQQKSQLGISVKATPSPRPAPGMPTHLTTTISVNGTLELAWKCKNPASAGGTTYQIYRRTTPTGAFVYLGGSGDKEWEDTSIPAGVSSITYQIQAVRSTGPGPWAQFNVVFGGGGVNATQEDAEPMRVAA